MADMNDTPEAVAPVPTRAERLRATHDAWAAWAETATTDDPPGDLSVPQPASE